ncbi:MAG: SIMPL domain-containing protein [Cyanobacteria bacterium P01_H01_bin.130]
MTNPTIPSPIAQPATRQPLGLPSLPRSLRTGLRQLLGKGLMVGAIALPLSQGSFMAAAIARPGLPQPLAQATVQERVISVQGQGAVAIPVTHTRLVVGIEVQGRSASETQSQLAAQANGLVDWLEGQDIEDLQTQSINLSPRYDRNSVLTGYVGRTTLTFRTPLEQSGSLIDGSVRNGATRINNITLTASPEAIRAAHKRALELAAQSAQGEADTVLAALGLTRKEIVGIQVQGSAVPQTDLTRGAMLEAAAAPTPVVGGEQTVNAFVRLQIRY